MGQGTCARGEFCASAIRERQPDGSTRRVPVECPRSFCDADWTIIGAALAAIPGEYVRLAAQIGNKTRGEMTVRSPFGPSVPLRLDIDEVMRLLVDVVLTWHELTAAAIGLSVPGTTHRAGTAAWRAASLGARAGELLPPSVKVLGANITTLLGLEAGTLHRGAGSILARLVYTGAALDIGRDTVEVTASGRDAGNEILRVEWVARAALLETPPAVTKLLGVACRQGECRERRELVLADPPQHDGDPEYHSRCTRCADLMTLPEFREHVTRYEAFYRDRLTPAQRAAVLAGRPHDDGRGVVKPPLASVSDGSGGRA